MIEDANGNRVGSNLNMGKQVFVIEPHTVGGKKRWCQGRIDDGFSRKAELKIVVLAN